MEKFSSQKKQVRSALERIDALESTLNNLALAIDQILRTQGQQLSSDREAITALVSLTGKEQVEKTIQEARDAAALEEVNQAQAALMAEVAAGRATKVNKIGENSLIVGNETSADGKVIPPGRMQVKFAGLKPEFRDKLLGQGPGFEVSPTPGGGVFKVDEVYDLKAAEPEPAVEPEASVAAPEAPQAAPAGAEGITPSSVSDAPTGS